MILIAFNPGGHLFHRHVEFFVFVLEFPEAYGISCCCFSGCVFKMAQMVPRKFQNTTLSWNYLQIRHLQEKHTTSQLYFCEARFAPLTTSLFRFCGVTS